MAAGCSAPREASGQLSRVAKDWSLTIRASQVLPIYPLSEDLQPGDLFISQTPIGQEVKLFESKGFLPLDNHIGRIQPEKYGEFYAVTSPRRWDFPPKDAAAAIWAGVPCAAFPSYTYDIDRSASVSAQLPLSSVPIGLSILGAHTATASVTIADATTYGIDRMSLDAQVNTWSQVDANKKYLKDHFAPFIVYDERGGAVATQQNWLRVVSRVYLTGRVDVSLRNNDTFGGSLDVQTPLPATLLKSTTDPPAAYSGMVDALNSGISKSTAKAEFDPKKELAAGSGTDLATAGAAPGTAADPPKTKTASPAAVSVKVAAVSARSISLAETFPRPVVIGYIAFDYPIELDGSLGRSVATLAHVTGEVFAADDATGKIRGWLESNREGNLPLLKVWMTGRAPGTAVTNFLYEAEFSNLRGQAVRDFKIP